LAIGGQMDAEPPLRSRRRVRIGDSSTAHPARFPSSNASLTCVPAACRLAWPPRPLWGEDQLSANCTPACPHRLFSGLASPPPHGQVNEAVRAAVTEEGRAEGRAEGTLTGTTPRTAPPHGLAERGGGSTNAPTFTPGNSAIHSSGSRPVDLEFGPLIWKPAR
jgi:hypothetical protein